MDRSYWINRWEKGDTTWHQDAPEPQLVTNFSKMKPTRIFVPLCGKSLDLFWLASQGHEVVGVEWSELGCRSFFEEAGLPFTRAERERFTVYEGGRITLLNGDFFDLRSKDLGPIGALYDRAALIALPPEIRARYVQHMKNLIQEHALSPVFYFLQLTLERTPHDLMGPPFSVPARDLAALYGPEFQVIPVSREEVEPRGVNGARMDQCVCRLSKSF